MKNHIRVDGRLLQTNKKWSALKQSQREWIHAALREEHVAFVERHGKLPVSRKKHEIYDRVYERIEARGIWVPFGEFKAHANKALDRLNRKSPLFTPAKPKGVGATPLIAGCSAPTPPPAPCPDAAE